MKKLKLLTSLSVVATAGATVPVASTSCSERYNFDGEYNYETILGVDAYSPQNQWIKEFFLYDGKPWSDPLYVRMDDSYDDPNAIAYLNENIHSVKQFAGAIIYSMLLRFDEIRIAQEGTTQQYKIAYPTQFKISDSDFLYNASEQKFSMSFTIDLRYENIGYKPVAKIRTVSGKKLGILRVCKYNDNLNSFVIGTGYDEANRSLDFGVEVNIYSLENNAWTDWQEMSVLNSNTNTYIDGITTLYFPCALCAGAEFKQSRPEVWLTGPTNTGGTQETHMPYIEGDKERENSCIINLPYEEGGENIYLFTALLDINGVVAPLTLENVNITIISGSDYISVVFGGTTIAIHLKDGFDKQTSCSFYITVPSYVDQNCVFSVRPEQ